MADLFAKYGIEYKPKDLFAEYGIEAPKASEVNSNLGNQQLLDVDKYKEMSRLYDERLAELKAKKEEKSVSNMLADLSMDENGEVEWQWYNPMSWIGSSVAENRKYIDDQIKVLEQNEELIKSSMSPEQFKEIKDLGAVGVFESFKRNLKWENAPVAGGFIEGYKKSQISDVMEKIRDGEELSDAENSLIKEYMDDQIELSIRGTSFGGKVVDGVARMPAFMIEYAVAKGLLGKTASIASKTSIGQKVISTAGKAADAVSKTGKVGTAAVGVTKATAKASGRAVFMPSVTYNNYNDIRINDIYSIGENGQTLFNEDPQNKATMVLKAFGLSTITALAEDSGEGLTALAKRGASPIFNKLPVGVRNELVKLARKTEKYKDTPISKMFSKGGYSNLLAEIGEERLEAVLGAATGLNPQGDTYFDSIGNALLPEWEQFMVEAGVISVAGGARSGLNYLYKKGYTPQFLKSLSTTEQDRLVEKEIEKDLAKPQGGSFEVVEVPLDKISLSEDIPNFKEGSNENGVVAGEQLQGKYDRIGTPPIVLWQRNDGRLEIITGRHRLDLARRTNEATIPAQILKEADGFTAQKARMLDVEHNIRDEKGTVRDYARYFKNTSITKEEANGRGLLARSKGRAAFSIARDGTDLLYAGFINGKISEGKAEAIASGAPNNESAQAAGIKAASKMDASALKAYVSILSQSTPAVEATGDMFGFDDGAIKEAEAIAKLVAKDKKEISDKIRAVKGALQNPQAAIEMGLKFDFTPENIGKTVDELRIQLEKLDKFFTNPEMMQYYRSILKGEKTRDRDAILADMPAEYLFDKPQEPKQAAEKKDDAEDPEVVDMDDSETWFEAWNRHLFDTVAPLEKISNLAADDLKDGQRPDLLARTYQYSKMMIEKNISDQTYYIDESGNEVNTGEGLTPILKDFAATFSMVESNKRKALNDFNDYLVAIRYTEDLDEMEDVEVTEQQKVDAIAAIARVQEKYGENFNLFEDFANRIYAFQQRILHNLVDSGNLSEEQFEEITGKHKHYVPFKRVLDDKEIRGGISGRPIFDEAKTSKAIKKIKGSDKDVKNVFVSIGMNAANIIDLAYRNKVARSVANLQTILPQYIKPRKPLYEKGKTSFKVAFDPKLRQQLEQAIKILGGTLEYKKSLRAWGQYNPKDNKILKRLGSQDRTLAHEFGHMLDFTYNIGAQLLSNPVLNKEINRLAEERFYNAILIDVVADKEGNPKYRERQLGDVNEEYIRNDRELIANMFDLYFTSRDYMKKTAPNTYKVIEATFTKNKQLAFLKDIAPSSTGVAEEIEKDVWVQSRQKPYGNVIEYYENGTKKYVEVAKPIYEAMHQLNPIQAGWLEKLFRIASFPVKMVRVGATATPNFIVRNFIKDQFTAFVQTEKGMKTTPFNTLKALCSIVGKGDLYTQWQKSGGSGSGYYDWSEEGAKRYLDELQNEGGRFWKAVSWLNNDAIWKKAVNAISAPISAPAKAYLNTIEKASRAVEEATRLGAFEQAKKAGLSDIAAAIKSREATVDFARGGDVSKLINRFVPFFNVGMQSANKLYRTAKNNPAAFMFSSLTTIVLPSIMVTGYYLYGAPDEEREKWLQIPDYVRDNNWCYFNEAGELITIPKPFTVGYMGTIVEDFMIWGCKEEKPEAREWYNVMLGAVGSLSPVQTVGSLLTPVGQAVIEWMSNYNFFQGRSIYPAWMEKLPAEERKLKTTSKVAQYFGKKLDVSPAVLDNSFFALTSTLGKQVLRGGENMFDQFQRWNNEQVPNDIIVKKDIPLVGALFGRLPDGTRSKSYHEFADNYKRLSEIKAAYSAKSGAEKAEYREKHHKDLADFKRLENFKDQIRRTQKQIDRIYDDPDMSSEEKTEQIIQLERQITQTAFNANKALKRED